MRTNKKELILLGFTAIYQNIQYFLWVFRWDQGDSLTYFYSAEAFQNIFNSSAYELSSYFYQPWFILFGYSIAVLMIGAFVYRLLIYILLNKINSSINKIILLSFLLFPAHGLLSFFPGRDLFAILFIFLSIGFALKNQFLPSLIFSFFVAKFRLISAIPLLLVLLFEISQNLKIKINNFYKIFFGIIVFCLSIFWIYKNLEIFGYGSNLEAILYRVQIEIDSDYFNLQGFKSFPLNLLNLYFPLLSPQFITAYSILGLESLFASFLIIKGYFGSNYYKIPRVIKNISIIQFACTIFACAIYPNVTDMARKIYPMFFYASIIFYYFRIRKNSALKK